MLERVKLHRLDLLALVGILIFLVLLTRLFYLQILEGQKYHEMAEDNRLRIFPINAPRGNFYDRNGVLMVTSKPGYNISILPYANSVTDVEISALSALTGTSVAIIQKRIKEKRDTFELAVVKINAAPEIIAKIRENPAQFPGVVIDVQPTRNYLFNNLAAHMFGYVSEISDEELERKKKAGYVSGDIVGQDGIEEYYDKDIRGLNGGKQVEVDVGGRQVATLNEKRCAPGNNLILTIDYRIQMAAELALDKKLAQMGTKAAAVCVINPRNGEVLALASRPTYDPNSFASGISEKMWRFYNDNPFRTMENKAIAGEYPPGSTFKLVTGTAALELKKVGPDEKIFDSGRHWLIPKTNAQGEALGWISFQEALSKSDNVYFFEMGNRLGIDNLETYGKKFGVGMKTGIDLPGESEGLMANKAYKEKVYHEDWYLSETFDAAIGQGFDLVTPLQDCELMAQIASGGVRYKPFIVRRIVDQNGATVREYQPQVKADNKISPASLNLIRAALRDVCKTGGTAGYTFADFPIPVAGKTGTAENPNGRDHSWFIAYAPYDNPQLCISVLVEQGGFGAEVAAPIAREVIAAAFNLPLDGDIQIKTDTLRYFGEVY